MSAETAMGILGIVITTVIAVYAILDARKLVRKNLKMQRDIAYLRVKNDLVWEFIDPTDSAYSVQIAKGLHEFGILAQALNPDWTEEAIRKAVENESLQFAEELVNSGRAKWKNDFDLEKVRHEIRSWQAEKNVEKVKKMMGSQA
jgi:hypothetical protein